MFKDYLKDLRPEVVKSGLQLWLDAKDFLNNPPTTLWKDRSGVGNNATASNFGYIKTASGSDEVGGVVFDGVNDICTIPDCTALDFKGGDFTIGMSINMKVINAMNVFLCKRYSSTSNYAFLVYCSTTNIYFNYTNDGTTANGCIFTQTLGINTKYRIVFRRIGISLKLFINNVLVSDQSIATNIIFTSTENLVIGAINTNGTKGQFLNGSLSNLLIYKGHGFTDAEVAQDYYATK